MDVGAFSRRVQARGAHVKLSPELVQAIREEIRAGFICDPPVAHRDVPHDIELQRRVLASIIAGIEPGFDLVADDFCGGFHQAIFDFVTSSEGGVRTLADPYCAEFANIEDCPVMVGKPLRDGCETLRDLANLRRCSLHLQKAIAIISVAATTGWPRGQVDAEIRKAGNAIGGGRE